MNKKIKKQEKTIDYTFKLFSSLTCLIKNQMYFCDDRYFKKRESNSEIRISSFSIPHSTSCIQLNVLEACLLLFVML